LSDALGESQALKAIAQEEGFALCGIAEVQPSRHHRFFLDWLERGLHGTMDYLSAEPARGLRRDPEGLLEGARSLLVVGDLYAPPAEREAASEDPSLGVISRYARGRDYHRVMKARLGRIHNRFQQWVGESVSGRAFVDSGPILEREIGERAGLGWLGQNTLLIHPRKGSYFFLGALLLARPLQADPPLGRSHCGSCRACVDQCPTGALLGRDASGAPVMDARRCISYLTIESRGAIPRELRPLLSNRIYGCDICQEVCPFNLRFTEPAGEPGYAARGPGEAPVGVEALSGEGEREPSADPLHPGTQAPSLIDLLEMALDPVRWDAFSRGSAIRRAGRAGFARNVCVAMGNWLTSRVEPPPEALRVLSRALSDPETLVRVHAAWALGKIPSREARRALEARTEVESNAEVRGELDRALA